MKTLVVYVYHSHDWCVDLFIKNGIFLDPDVDFVIVINGNPRKGLPEIPSYVTVIIRPNLGFDFGGWSVALWAAPSSGGFQHPDPAPEGNRRYDYYDNFIFVNNSVAGPMSPGRRWIDRYLELLTPDRVLVGSTINCQNLHHVTKFMESPHVQSYAFALTKTGLMILIQERIFDPTSTISERDEAVIKKEIPMSRTIIKHGYNIGCLHHLYRDDDFRFTQPYPKDRKWFVGNCSINQRGEDLDFEEVMFKKKYLKSVYRYLRDNTN